MDLLNRTDSLAYAPETIFTAAGTGQHFREHLSATFEPLLGAYRLALDNAIKYQSLAEDERDLELQLKAFTEDQRTVIDKGKEDD